MALELGIGFLAGVITSISPCVLPVLPILLAGSATGTRRKPYAIAAGLIVSFSAFTLAGAWLLDLAGLPQDLLRNVALALLFLVAATLLVPAVATLVERPFAALTRRPAGDLGGGVLLGASLGLVFVPCAGPVLAALTSLAASRNVGAETVLLMVAYAAGAATPMLFVGIGGQRTAQRAQILRRHAVAVRQALGVVVVATALAIAFSVDRHLQTAIPGYVSALQGTIEESDAARDYLADLTDRGAGSASAAAAGEPLDDFGPPPNFRGVSTWLNTAKPLSLRALRGRVVLVDFWTYTCINCLRTLPHVRGWYERYREAGLVVVGVHSPEFAFERVPRNVRGAVARLDIDYPVALDNDFDTWNAYQNQYWPAKYLIDRRGHLRYAHFGEGAYAETEELIRRLLAEGRRRLPAAGQQADRTPRDELTPESYLGHVRIDRYAGSPLAKDRWATYRLPDELPEDSLAYGGRWRVESERAVAGRGARVKLRFRARDVHLVLSGRGHVDVLVDNRRERVVRVDENRLYKLVSRGELAERVLELRLTPGLAAYAFTFG